MRSVARGRDQDEEMLFLIGKKTARESAAHSVILLSLPLSEREMRRGSEHRQRRPRPFQGFAESNHR